MCILWRALITSNRRGVAESNPVLEQYGVESMGTHLLLPSLYHEVLIEALFTHMKSQTYQATRKIISPSLHIFHILSQITHLTEGQ